MRSSSNAVQDIINQLTQLSTKETEMPKNENTKINFPIDFGIGHPHESLKVSKNIIGEAMISHLKSDNEWSDSIEYGINEGSWYARCAIGEWVDYIWKTNNQKLINHPKWAQEIAIKNSSLFLFLFLCFYETFCDFAWV